MKNVLITGSSKGIGKAIALALAKDSSDTYNIALHYNSNKESALETLSEIKQLGVESRLIQFDVSDRASTKKAIVNDIDKNGAYYGIVCNAGITSDGAFPLLTDKNWDNVVNTNIGGFYNVLKPAIIPMIQSRKPGRIITMASVSAIAGNRGQTNYSASKAAVIGASKSLAIELAKRNITVNCIAPGLIDTDMVKTVELEYIIQHIPMRRIGQPKEVASLVLFLLSDSASYITRQVISVNGGLY